VAQTGFLTSYFCCIRTTVCWQYCSVTNSRSEWCRTRTNLTLKPEHDMMPLTCSLSFKDDESQQKDLPTFTDNCITYVLVLRKSILLVYCESVWIVWRSVLNVIMRATIYWTGLYT